MREIKVISNYLGEIFSKSFICSNFKSFSDLTALQKQMQHDCTVVHMLMTYNQLLVGLKLTLWVFLALGRSTAQLLLHLTQ